MNSPRSDDSADLPEERGDVADALAPPPAPSKATRSPFLLGVLGLIALCLVVFAVALALR